MTHDQMTLFAAPTAPTESPSARPRAVRKPAGTRSRAGHDAVRAPVAQQASTGRHDPPDATLTKFGSAGTAGPEVPAPQPPIPLFDTTPPMTEMHDTCPPAIDDAPNAIRSDRLWQLDGWTARVIKNEDDDGWAVEMLKDGEAEPALVGPWTMGRDKKNPKPLDQAAFSTLVKTATEVLQRHAQQAHALLHKSLTVFALDAQWEVRLDITPDEYEPFATLSAFDEAGDEVAQVRVSPGFRLNASSASAWILGGFARPGGKDNIDY